MINSCKIPIYFSTDLSEKFFHDIKLSDVEPLHAIETKRSYPLIQFIENTSEKRKQIQEFDIGVLVSEENLDLFSPLDKEDHLFEVSSKKELFELWPLLSHLMKNYYTCHIQKMYKRHKKSIEAKLKKYKGFDYDEKFNTLILKLIELSYSHLLDFDTLSKVINDTLPKVKVISISKEIFKEENILWEPLTLPSGQSFLLSSYDEKNLYRLFSFLKNYLSGFDALEEIKKINDQLELVKSKVSIPFLIQFADEGINFNQLFSQLNISVNECLKLINDTQVEINKVSYRVLINEDEHAKQYLFFPIDEYLALTAQPTSQELGIISSSLAHEINNPLAGILAAVNLFELEEIDDEAQEQLAEMKMVINRCKSLVEIFLGFSKLENNLSEQTMGDIKEIFDRGVELMRFRIIESNLDVLWDYKKEQRFTFIGNTHILAMSFYLVFSELLTLMGHQNLLNAQSKSEFFIKLEEKKNALKFIYEKDIKISDSFLHSKLFKHLCDIAGLKTQSDFGQLLFFKDDQ